MKQRITILGATGSIGQSTLAVLAQHPEQYELFAVTANGNVDDMAMICRNHRPRYAVMANPQAAQQLQQQLGACATTVLAGDEQVAAVAAAADVDIVMAEIGRASCRERV